MWGSRGVTVLRDDVTGVRGLQAVSVMCDPVLQRRRLGVSLHHSDRQQGGVHRNSTEVGFTPPLLLYHKDFAEAYCGFERGTVGYTRPLAERSIIRVEGDRKVCCKSVDTFLPAHYATRRILRLPRSTRTHA